MIEELLCELDKSQRAVSLLIKNFEYYVYENISGNQKINRKEFIPQQMTQITYFETENINRAEPSNLQIEMRQRSQNISSRFR